MLLASGGFLLGVLLTGCGSGTRSAGLVEEQAKANQDGTDEPVTPPPPTDGHPAVALLDRLGAPIQQGSTEPYSPRRTCGGCHNIDQAAGGYHFQQGRTDAADNVQVRPNFYGDGRDFVRSDGMYGKW
jgi:hypothetical protein